jgi:hypothetical protein
VAPAADLERKVSYFAINLIPNFSGPILITKERINAVMRAMNIGLTALADDDSPILQRADEESREAVQAYGEEVFPAASAPPSRSRRIEKTLISLRSILEIARNPSHAL